MIRNVNIIGNLWPLCKTCGHIAQSHDQHGCMEPVACPHCGKLDSKVQCSCKEYAGPTLGEFMRDYMTPEERKHYAHVWRITYVEKEDGTVSTPDVA